MVSNSLVHVLLVSFPGQGHVNPLLRLGKRLASKGMLVTFSAPEGLGKQMRKANNITDQPVPVGDGFIRFEFFEDGWEEDDPRRQYLDQFLSQLELAGKQAIPQMIKKHSEQGHPVSCLINNPFFPWVSDVAESLGLPSAVLWIQSCACFSAYYHYSRRLVPFPTEENPEIDVQLPCMPLLKCDEVPSFLHPSTPYPFLGKAILDQFKNLGKPFCILMETFQELERDLIEYMSKLCPILPVGPLFKDPKAPTATVRGDFLKADDCIEWLNSKPPSSAVYVSFGSVEQGKNSTVESTRKSSSSPISCMLRDTLWMELNNGSTLLRHAGGGFPSMGDQVTDAKFLVDVFEVGVRMSRGDSDNKLITRDEVEKCLLEATVGPKAAALKQNALKWKAAAEAAVARVVPQTGIYKFLWRK
ncbi:hypothetical protein GH714_013754 [Hevea brasiliensis]|uniref:Glycosyltransferase N-terminal domain-containing protein n=1 Tax=Hevea brasiliensis TaxID=3981 RepID=A0A6A6L377_HEVBR|nr:hypothetical protein GH714_013754 [Hevea brasiliensis]